jgi:hypothetical protein
MLFVEGLGVAPAVEMERIIAIIRPFHHFVPDRDYESAFFQFPFSVAEYNSDYSQIAKGSYVGEDKR